MHKRKLTKKILKLLILLLCLLLLFKFINYSVARYESDTFAKSNIQVAFYVIKKDYQTMNLNLDSLFPDDKPYTYKFSISNSDGNKICETDMEYDLRIRTTTNLPLEFELYLNEPFDKNGAKNIIIKNEVIKDEFGTYFRLMNVDKKQFSYKRKETNVYQLVVKFPKKYNTINYQDIIDTIEIIVDSNQII